MPLFLLFLFVIVLLLPLRRAHAQIDCPYDIEKVSILYTRLHPQVRRLYDDTYTAIRHGESTVPLPEGMSPEMINEFTYILKQESSQLIAADWEHATYSWHTENNETRYTRLNLAYCRSIQEQDNYIEKLKNISLRFRGMDELSGIMAIHDFVCESIHYDHDAVKNDLLHTRQLFFDSLNTHWGVCNAYAQGMSVLCHFSGYQCSFINGYGGKYDSENRHAWNIVKIGEEYTYIDATWDDDEQDDNIMHVHFGVGFDRFYRSHWDDDAHSVYALLPLGRELQPLICGEQELSEALDRERSRHAERIVLCFTPFMYQQFIRDRAFWRILKEHGIHAEGCTLHQSAYAVTFYGCTGC